MSAQHNINLNFIAWLITTDYSRAWLEFARKFNCELSMSDSIIPRRILDF